MSDGLLDDLRSSISDPNEQARLIAKKISKQKADDVIDDSVAEAKQDRYLLNFFKEDLNEVSNTLNEAKEKLLGLLKLPKIISKERESINQNLSDLSKYIKGLIVRTLKSFHSKHYDSPSTLVDFIFLAIGSVRLNQLVIKIETLPTTDDEESLSLEVLVNGVAMDFVFVIDDTFDTSKLQTVRLPVNKLKRGDKVDLKSIYVAGTVNSLAGISISIEHQIFEGLAS